MSTRTLRVCTWLLVGAIALIAFGVSFEAIRDYAVRVGAFPHWLGWCAPLLVDAFTVAAGLVVLIRAREHVRAVYAWSLIAAASLVSVTLNIAHAPPHLAARLVAALPSTALLAAVELGMSEARRSRSAPQPTHSAEAAGSGSAQPALESAPPGPGAGASVAASAEVQGESRLLVRTLLAERADVSVDEVMERAGIGRRRAYELLRQERAALNGGRG